MYYRVTVRGTGIYQYIDEVCPKGDPRREAKPDGSWLNKAGVQYDNSISWWTEQGWKEYTESGLRAWHNLITDSETKIEIIQSLSGEIVYQDRHQVLVTRP